MEAFDRKVDAISDAMNLGWNEAERVSAWNEYCDRNNIMDDYIYSMYDIDDILGKRKVSEILDIISDNFNSRADFFLFNGYGYLVSGDYADDFDCYDEDAVAEYIAENGGYDFPDIDEDYLVDGFVSLFDEGEEERVREFLEENDIDLLDEDWDSVVEEVDKYLKTGNSES